MTDRQVASCVPEPWYHWWRFALLPNVRIRKADEWNEWGLSGQWLIFRFWTLASPGIGLQVDIESTSIGAWILIPYLKMGFMIPIMPMKFGYWVQRTFWRRGTRRLL